MILRRASWHRIVFVELLLNLATHPLLWFSLPLVPGSYGEKLIVGETLVFGAEISLGLWLYRGLGSGGRIAASVFFANLVTFLLTFLL